MQQIDVTELEPPRYKLGSGEFGRVFDALFHGKPVVYKIMKHAIHNKVLFENELQILYSLKNMPNVPLVYGFARCKERNIFYIIMEKAPGITLYNYVCYTDIPFLSRLFIAKNICRTIARLHERNVMYRDLKPDNIVIDPTNNDHVLIDFGLAVQCTSMSDCVDGMVGTPGYMAPEIYREQTYSFPVDIYSLGMTLYFLFRCREAERLSVLRYHLHHSNTPKFIQSIILDCLWTSPCRRPTAIRLYHAFADIYDRLDNQSKKQEKKKKSLWSWWCGECIS